MKHYGWSLLSEWETGAEEKPQRATGNVGLYHVGFLKGFYSREMGNDILGSEQRSYMNRDGFKKITLVAIEEREKRALY